MLRCVPGLVSHLSDLIKDSDRLPAMKRAELKGVISTKPGLSRFLQDHGRRPFAHRC